ncbi:hypothetical protein SUGI_0380260 [Cryptomeria japonica]|uniref:arginine-specific demethylase JMJ20 isoform X2 n=1 Tax=Cryptomeria japonica TaxID=3369 RepID=UPI002408A6E5|nr:arginine-specific demethylase JMJ20 isoform X2 [Cryptomeria japonica]GLJ20856.1 hypothetical protein SUGI_0380260 [Cryptomeria japonica]
MKIVGQIPRVNGSDLSYAEFREKYMMRNEPVILTGLMDGWRACTDWVSQDGRPNLSFFSQHCGNSLVQVADCDRKEFTDQKRIEMTVSKYIEYWHNLDSQRHDMKRDGSSLLYLKDWHFVKEFPGYISYTTPKFFMDDWLNLYLDNFHMHGFQAVNAGSESEVSCSDYRFVYMGPKGTWTPLHADVFRSYSWSANICGKKVWHFLSPSQSHLLYDRYMKHTVYDIYGDVCAKQFPGFFETSWLECVQERNEIIFVPSGWYHQVKNVEDTISINHNWFNACNISWVWNLLVKDYNETKEYIEDIRSIADDFESLCQRNLAANTGMNFNDYFVFISRMALANVIQLIDILDFRRNSMEPSEVETVQQLLFNLASICDVAKKLETIDYFDGYSREHTFDLQETSVLCANLEISKDLKIHELKESLKEKYSFFHNVNVANTSADLVDEVENNGRNSIFQGSEKKRFLKTNEREITFSDEIFSVMLKDHSTEKYRVNIVNPQHLVQIINNIITSAKERAHGVVT